MSFGAGASLLYRQRLGSLSSFVNHEDRILCVIMVRAFANIASAGGSLHLSQLYRRRRRRESLGITSPC